MTTSSRVLSRVLGRAIGSSVGPFRAAILAALLALALVAGAGAPAAALRSGPDVAIRVNVEDGRIEPAATGYVPPVPGVDPPAGVERMFDPPEQEWGAGHRGVDLTAPAGTRVVSPGPGVVTFAGQVARRGVVVVTHPDGLRSSLEPVAASVPVGTAVVAGAAIGVVEGGDSPGGGIPGGVDPGGGSPGGADPGGGTTPNHCAPKSCVHWGVRRGERYIDPLSLLDRPPIVLLPDH